MVITLDHSSGAHSDNLTIWRLSFVLKKGQMTLINQVYVQILRPLYLY